MYYLIMFGLLSIGLISFALLTENDKAKFFCLVTGTTLFIGSMFGFFGSPWHYSPEEEGFSWISFLWASVGVLIYYGVIWLILKLKDRHER
jgi:hypothetical protein